MTTDPGTSAAPTGDADEDPLQAAWFSFCDSLKATFADVAGDDTPDDPVTRAAGVQYLQRVASLALDLLVEHSDPLHPELWSYFGTTRKQAGDNPDAVYFGAHIDGTQTYRIIGTRGSASYLLFTAVKSSAERGGRHTGDLLYGNMDGFAELMDTGDLAAAVPQTSGEPRNRRSDGLYERCRCLEVDAAGGPTGSRPAFRRWRRRVRISR